MQMLRNHQGLSCNFPSFCSLGPFRSNRIRDHLLWKAAASIRDSVHVAFPEKSSINVAQLILWSEGSVALGQISAIELRWELCDCDRFFVPYTDGTQRSTDRMTPMARSHVRHKVICGY